MGFASTPLIQSYYHCRVGLIYRVRSLHHKDKFIFWFLFSKELLNMSPYGEMVPPMYSERKVLHVEPDQLLHQSHLLIILPKTKKNVRFPHYYVLHLADFIQCSSVK